VRGARVETVAVGAPSGPVRVVTVGARRGSPLKSVMVVVGRPEASVSVRKEAGTMTGGTPRSMELVLWLVTVIQTRWPETVELASVSNWLVTMIST
jgi:hypothetical protein